MSSSANLDKIKYNAKVAKKVLDVQIGQEETERRNREKALANIAKLSDPKYIKETKLDRIYQSKDKAETQAGILVAENCKNLKQEIYNFLTNGLDRKAPFNEVEERINICLGLLKNYRMVVENEYVNQKAQATTYTLYGQLFNELIKYNANFSMFMPKECVKNTVVATKIRTLPEVYQNAVNERIEKLNVNEKADYVNEYIVCEFEPSEKTQQVEEMNLKLQQLQTSAVDILEQATDKMGVDLLNLIKEEYSLIQKEREVTTKDVLDIIGLTQRERKLMFDFIKDNKFVAERMSKRKMNAYDEMYNEMVNLDIKFALAAPRKVLGRLDLDFKVFTEREKDVMFERICKMGLWNIPQYVENYHDLFACQISKINITNQA